MIRLRDLKFRYPEGDFSLALDELIVERGQSAALIGPSGCGKSTLLNLMAGILTPASGSVRVGDTDVHLLDDSQRRLFRLQQIGFVFQDFALIDYLTVRDNILHPWRINAAVPLAPAVKKRAGELARQLNIGEKLSRYPGQLSQGEQQRAAICRALAPKPSILIADEPTGNLDPSNKRAILDILLEYTRIEEATLVLATHDHDLLPAFDTVIDFSRMIVPSPDATS
jgi:putative ABC transport system ATP-binding protein